MIDDYVAGLLSHRFLASVKSKTNTHKAYPDIHDGHKEFLYGVLYDEKSEAEIHEGLIAFYKAGYPLFYFRAIDTNAATVTPAVLAYFAEYETLKKRARLSTLRCLEIQDICDKSFQEMTDQEWDLFHEEDLRSAFENGKIKGSQKIVLMRLKDMGQTPRQFLKIDDVSKKTSLTIQ